MELSVTVDICRRLICFFFGYFDKVRAVWRTASYTLYPCFHEQRRVQLRFKGLQECTVVLNVWAKVLNVWYVVLFPLICMIIFFLERQAYEMSAQK